MACVTLPLELALVFPCRGLPAGVATLPYRDGQASPCGRPQCRVGVLLPTVYSDPETCERGADQFLRSDEWADRAVPGAGEPDSPGGSWESRLTALFGA